MLPAGQKMCMMKLYNMSTGIPIPLPYIPCVGVGESCGGAWSFLLMPCGDCEGAPCADFILEKNCLATPPLEVLATLPSNSSARKPRTPFACWVPSYSM